MSSALPEILLNEISKLLAPIIDSVEDPISLDSLLTQLGVPIDNVDRNTLLGALEGVAELKSQLDELATLSDLSFDSIANILNLSRQVFDTVRSLNDLSVDGNAMEGFGRDLVSFLFMVYLARWHPLARNVANLVTLLESVEELDTEPPVVDSGEIVRESYSLDRFHLSRLVNLVHDPASTMRSEYGNSLATVEDASAIAQKLFPRLLRLFRCLGISCRYGFDPDDDSILGDAAPLIKNALIIYADDLLAGAPSEAGFVLNLSSADSGDLGLVISPFGSLTFTRELGDWIIELAITAGIDVVAYGRHGLTLLAGTDTTEVKGSFSAKLDAPTDEPAYIIGSPTSTRLEVGGAQFKIETTLSETSQSLEVSADILSSALIIPSGEGDGFIKSVLPSNDIRAEFDLGIAWSNKRGLTLRGSASLDATIPIGLSLGGISLSTINLRLQTQDTEVYAEVSATIKASIGPIQALIDRVGIESKLSFPEEGGNLGVANLHFGFKPPTGVGISIDGAMVSGGGFLRYNSEKELYSGIVHLTLSTGLNLKGIGLIATRLPDQSNGYSLLIIITAEGFNPIPLGLGFVLTGIGGLLAINRTFDEEVLRSGLKSNVLDSVLFPKDPIGNAPQLLNNLDKVFPAARGHHLFGPIVQIAWGTPALITAELAVLLEIGERLRMLILAQVEAILPRRDKDLVRLKMDAIGVLDFNQGTAALDATLYDSRLLKKFALTGDMAMRLKWMNSPNFAMAVGGLHPAYNPPPDFPKLKRISLDLSSSNNPRLRCEAYFALTSNTVQFGARAELFASAVGFSIHGDIGFDVLISLDPFQFTADFHAQVQLKRGSTNLFKVRVEGALSGPSPLHIKAKATFEVLWFDVTFRIDKTLVSGVKPEPPKPIVIMPLLKEALSNPGSWTMQLPASQRQMITSRPLPPTITDVPVHPLGTITIKQNIVPLDLDITKFGQTSPSGDRRFTIRVIDLGEQNADLHQVKDFFAPAQFLEMSDNEKLSRPSFESMTSGLTIGTDEFVFTTVESDCLEVDTIQFETVIVDKQQGSSSHRNSAPYQISGEQLVKQAQFGAAGVADLRKTGNEKYRTSRGGFKIQNENWIVVETKDTTQPQVPEVELVNAASYFEVEQAIRKLEQRNPSVTAGWKILRPSELLN